VIAALLLRMNAMPHFTGQSTLYQGRPQYTLFTAPAAFLWYVKQQLFPIETSVQYPLLAVREFSWLQFMFPLLVIAAIGAGVILWSRRSAAARFLIAWGLLTLSPVIAFHIALQLHDRYAYLPSVAMSVGMAYVILRFIGDNKRAQAAVLVALIVGLGWATHRQAKYWSDDITLFEHAVKVAPDHHDAYTGLVAAYDDFGMQEKELETLQRWVAHTPTSPSRPAYTMFLYYIDRKDLPHAREAFERAKTGLRSVTLNVAYARLAMAENRCVDAERYYRLAIIAEPYVMDLHAQLAAAIGCQGRKQEAFEQLKKAWRVRDRDVE
jgi:tetratricopeptide (TPR) repeat protein